MSGHDEPYANGLGILIGILVLWIGTLTLVFGVKALFFPSAGEEAAAPDGATEEAAWLIPANEACAQDLFEAGYAVSKTAVSRV